MTGESDLPSSRPNILLFVTDQERWDCTAPPDQVNTPGAQVETPASDRLAREGMRFTQAYTPTAICSPARASLLTGLYPHNHGVLSNPTRDGGVRTDVPQHMPTVGEVLSDSGYRNTYIGKWHVGLEQKPEDFGFRSITSWNHGVTLDTEDYRQHARSYGVDPDAVELTDITDEDGVWAATADIPTEATQTYYLAERTIEALESHAENDTLFFHRTDFPGPHGPYIVPEPYASMYNPEDIEQWPSFAETFAGKPNLHEIRLEYYDVQEATWDTWREAVAKYFGFISFIEDQIDRILDVVDDLGLADDTLVVRSSDHGAFVGGHRQDDKGSLMYDEIYRIPLIARWPGTIEPGSLSDEFVSLLDLMPTFCDIAGSPVADVDGRSLVPLFGGEDPEWRDYIVGEMHGEPETLYTQRMIRDTRFKFIWNAPDINELYDVKTDPHELNNLIDHPQYDQKRQELAEALIDWMETSDDHASVYRVQRRNT